MALNVLGTHKPGIARLGESPNGLKPWVRVLAEVAFDPHPAAPNRCVALFYAEAAVFKLGDVQSESDLQAVLTHRKP